MQRLSLLLLLATGWAATPLFLGRENGVAWGLPAYAFMMVFLLLWFDRHALLPLLRPTRQAVLHGLIGAALMIALTYPALALANELSPGLHAKVTADRTPIASLEPLQFLPKMLVVIFAEELFWRGSWLGKELPYRLGLPLSLGSYCLVQFAVGSWVVSLVALVCGCFWLIQRQLTAGLIAPLISHALWSPTVLLFFPIGGP